MPESRGWHADFDLEAFQDDAVPQARLPMAPAGSTAAVSARSAWEEKVRLSEAFLRVSDELDDDYGSSDAAAAAAGGFAASDVDSPPATRGGDGCAEEKGSDGSPLYGVDPALVMAVRERGERRVRCRDVSHVCMVVRPW